MPYGIANSSGQPSCAVVAQIVGKAKELGISLIDTAAAYGDSESVLGAVIGADAAIRIVTKTRPIGSATIDQADVESVDRSFAASLTHLKRRTVYGLLVHEAGDLLASGGERLWDWLETVKSAGRAAKIGVSVYSPNQLQQLLRRYPDIEIVQLPFNVYDQRFARSGLLDALRAQRVEVHARSVFLQGLLLIPPDRLPAQFERLRDRHAELHDLLRRSGLSPLAGALSICMRDPRLDAVVVGCESPRQLAEIAAALDGDCDLGDFAMTDETVVDPRLWARPP